MITLQLRRDPHWLDLGHGVRIYVRPCTTALMMAARKQRVARTDDDASAAAALLSVLARLAILDWEGVADEAGDPATVTADNVAALIELWPVAEAFERLYLAPALLLDDEKNASAPAPNGTSAAGQITVEAAA